MGDGLSCERLRALCTKGQTWPNQNWHKLTHEYIYIDIHVLTLGIYIYIFTYTYICQSISLDFLWLHLYPLIPLACSQSADGWCMSSMHQNTAELCKNFFSQFQPPEFHTMNSVHKYSIGLQELWNPFCTSEKMGRKEHKGCRLELGPGEIVGTRRR